MAGSTTRLGLYLPGGGSTGSYGVDETADIDKINENMESLDAAVGAPPGLSTARPGTPFQGQLFRETDTGRLVWWSGLTWLRADKDLSDRIVIPTGVTVTGGGSGAIDATSGLVTLSGTCTQFRVDGAFPEENAEYEVLVWFEGVTGADATTDLWLGLADAGTPRTNLSGRMTDYPSGAPATTTSGPGLTNVDIVLNSVANASPGAVRLFVTSAKESGKKTRVRYEVDFGDGAGRRDGVLGNNTAQTDPTLRMGFSGTGSTIVAGTKLMIRRTIP